MALTWYKSLETGVEWQDKQHKELFNRVNRLLCAMVEKKGNEEIADLLNFLDNYVVVHFDAENQAMNKLQFKDRASHIAEHADFKSKLADIKKAVEKGLDSALVIRIQKQVTDWLMEHIGKVDKVLGKFITESSQAAAKIA
ncbi:MAG: hemerythrin family protein [Deltaproteobacteria bacterium]|nr:hemerythrin family protein [Deltaproteobacteria bacterium]